MLTNKDLEKISNLFDANNQRLINQMRAEFKYQFTEFDNRLQQQLKIEFGKVWEELRELRFIVETHVKMHNQELI